MDRRRFLEGTLVATAGLSLSDLGRVVNADPVGEPLPIAAIVTEYRENSHADVIIGKILEGYDQLGGPGPGLFVASMYTDQVPDNDLSRDLSRKYGFPIVPTIDEAITLGHDHIAVEGVLCIGEHGRYPYTADTRQHMYPRRRFFDETVAAFERCGPVVPIFNDKHLGYRWEDARHMVATAERLGIPFLAGSSLPVAWRIPPLTIPRGSRLVEAMALGYGGFEAYGFHALETLQCMVERRDGGETGVSRVQAVRGEAIWEAERAGRWSRSLLKAILERLPNVKPGRIEDNLNDSAAFYLIEYRDGFRANVAMLNGHALQFAFGATVEGQNEPLTTWFQLQDGKPYGHFGYLVDAIEHTIRTGTPAYPAERTLLTTGILDAVMHSLAEDGRPIATPELDVRYRPTDWPFAPGVPDPPRGP